MPFWKWSQTANTNGTADPFISWPEGMAPSQVNNSARGMMAEQAKWRDDTSGFTVTTGSASAYAVQSYSGFDKLPSLNSQMIAFTPHVTNATNPTLSVDGLADRPIMISPGVAVPAGVLIQGTPYQVLYNDADSAFYLFGVGSAIAGNPYNIPFLGGIDYWDTVTPGSQFIFPLGQAISRTTYSAAFARWGTTFGAGDGSTTFNIPNKAGRVSAMVGGNVALFASLGETAHTLTQAEMPKHMHYAAMYDPTHIHAATESVYYQRPIGGGATLNWPNTPGAITGTYGAINTTPSGTGVHINAGNGYDWTGNSGSDGAHNSMQPTIGCNYIIRII